MLDLAALLEGLGLNVHRFNFPYRAQGRKFPDKLPVLMECYAREIGKFRSAVKPRFLVLAGHSMGGRVASHLAAQAGSDYPALAAGLVVFSYPLHPPGRPDKLRDEHLPLIRMPVLSVSGTRDAFCERPRMERVLRELPKTWTQCWLEDADHGLAVPKKSGRTRAGTLEEAGLALSHWLKSLGK